jgi:hypothetical protein
MKRFIHTLVVDGRGAKLQFQIRLPFQGCAVRSILVAAQANQLDLTAPERRQLGSIWLRLPNSCDVFYANRVDYPNHLAASPLELPCPGIGAGSEFWIKGSKQTAATVQVPIQNTVLEGYYEDQSSEIAPKYVVRIYLELL